MTSFSEQPVRKYGVTDPISLSKPSDHDIKSSEALIATLRAADFFEEEEDARKREIVLGKLSVLVREFVRKVGQQQGMPDGLAAQTGANIYSFGSYRLGVHAQGADIDTLCVVPNHVSRDDFFTTFYDMLKKVDAITELTKVPDAYVPVMKMEFDGIAIDLLFARLAMSQIPEDLNLRDNLILKNIDDKCVVSLNGSRTTDEILSLVPSIPVFHTALRCIKLWAKRRGLYNNSMGYIGGVACAILTARICQLYPNAAPSTVVARFFAIYSVWQWPQPVMLKRIDYDGSGGASSGGGSGSLYKLVMKVWNPRKNPTDRNHRMPIITPAFPSMCSTHNVNTSTFNLMKYEFLRGKKLTAEIESQQADWNALLETSDFFYRFKHFIQVIVTAKSKEAWQLWKGFVESKLRLFVAKLETVMYLEGAPPFPDSFSFHDVVVQEGASVIDYFVHPPKKVLQFADKLTSSPKSPLLEEEANGLNEATTMELQGPVNESLDVQPTLHITCFYLALDISSSETASTPAPSNSESSIAGSAVVSPPAPLTTTIQPSRKLNLAGPVLDFKRLVQSWDKYQADEMDIFVRDLRRLTLPDHVFEGRPRPTVATALQKQAQQAVQSTVTPPSVAVNPVITNCKPIIMKDNNGLQYQNSASEESMSKKQKL